MGKTRTSSDTGMEPVTSKPDPERLKQAAFWFAVLAGDDVEESEKKEWQDWCNQSPENERAWRYIEKISQRFHLFEKQGQQDIAYSALSSSHQGALSRRMALRVFGGILLSAIGAGWLYSPVRNRFEGMLADHSTGIGEISSFMLNDGSAIWLNTDSAVNVRFTEQLRQMFLVRGEILVETAKDIERSFIVETDHAILRALGTRFSVYQWQDSTRLSVYDGSVDLTCRKSGQSRIVKAGWQVDFDSLKILPELPVKQSGHAWSQGLLLAERVSLLDFIRQLGRYHLQYVEVSEDVAAIPVMGTFPAQDLNKTLLMLQESLNVSVHKVMPWWIRIDAA